jgi:hypothetical protein
MRTIRYALALGCVVVLGLAAAGCGGGGSPAAATTARNGALGEALAFARCMRSHGIPNWPDPTDDGGFDKSKLRQLGVSGSRIRAIEESACNLPLGGRSKGPAITAADRVDYLQAAACMRRHGFPGFPDPTFRGNDVQTDIPSSIDQDAPRFRSAAAACTKLIPAGLPYSGNRP